MNRKVKAATMFFAVYLAILGVCYGATSIYYTINVPETRTFIYQASAYVNGTLWANGTQLVWGGNETMKQFDVQNTGNTNAHIYFIVGSNLPSGWAETWGPNATLCYPGCWLNGTLTLTAAGANGTYTWDSWVEVGP
jgi:hypothetical protein